MAKRASVPRYAVQDLQGNTLEVHRSPRVASQMVCAYNDAHWAIYGFHRAPVARFVVLKPKEVVNAG